MKNRELKFRVWDNVDYMSTPFTIADVQSKKIEFTSEVVIMQFTGLKDKNGKEIYEGDIIQSKPYIWSDDKLIKGKVIFTEKGIWRVEEITDYHTPDIEYLFEALKPEHESEVIGNIYENPELLSDSTH